MITIEVELVRKAPPGWKSQLIYLISLLLRVALNRRQLGALQWYMMGVMQNEGDCW